MRKSRSLRSHLLELALLSLIPAAVFSAIVVFALWKAQERERLTIQFQAVRAVAEAVEDAVDSVIMRARLLSRVAGSSDPQQYERLARLFRQESDDIFNVALRDPSGVQLFNLAAAGAPPYSSGERRPFHDEEGVTVTDVYSDPVTNRPVVDIILPLDTTRYRKHELLVSLDLAHFDRIVTQHYQTPGTLMSLLDREYRIIARSVDAEARRGRLISEQNIATITGKPEGFARISTLDRLHVFLTWTRTRQGWTISYGVPVSAIDAPLKQSLALLAGGWLLAFLLGLGLATRKERHLERYFDLLVRKAENIEGGKAMPFPESDITELNDVMRKLRRAREVLEEALIRETEARHSAEHANKAKDEFLAMLGHELRNPLSAIGNATRIIRMGQSSPEQLHSVTGIIARQTEHLTGIVDDLLEVSRVITGKIRLQRAPTNISDELAHVIDSLTISGRLARHPMSIEATDAWVDADRTRLEQVIQNLLINAATYTPPGGRIYAYVGLDGNSAILQIRDEGKGISERDLPHVFDLFFQAEQDTSRPYSGLGIGLTLVRRLVELHGGTIAAASGGVGKGSTFTVRLPAIPAPQIVPVPLQHSKPAPLRILIVEDNPDARESLKLALEADGHDVATVGDAAGALALLVEREPHVAVLDIGLPGMDGLELARAIRQRHGNDMYLIALTGYGSEKHRESAQAAGFDAHLTKPVDFEVLDELIARATKSESIRPAGKYGGEFARDSRR